MFLVVLTYIKPIEVVDALLDEHVRFLETYYARDVFQLSGRQVPRTGGVIMAKAANRESLMTILAEDPFYREGAARYEVIEFVPGKASEACQGLVEAPARAPER